MNREEDKKSLKIFNCSDALKLPQEQKKLNLQKAGSPSRPSGLLFQNLISVEIAAEALGVAPKTIHNWVSARCIPFIRVGRRVMFRPKSLELWLNRKEYKPWL